MTTAHSSLCGVMVLNLKTVLDLINPKIGTFITGSYDCVSQAMSARSEVLTVVQDIIKQKRTTPVTDEEEGTADILTILLQNIEEGHITQSEVEDQLIESVFSFQQGLSFNSYCLCLTRYYANQTLRANAQALCTTTQSRAFDDTYRIS